MTPFTLESEIAGYQSELDNPQYRYLGMPPIRREGARVFYDRNDELRWKIGICTEMLFLENGGRA